MAYARFTAAHAARDGELVRAGDSASLGLLFERYRPRLDAKLKLSEQLLACAGRANAIAAAADGW